MAESNKSYKYARKSTGKNATLEVKTAAEMDNVIACATKTEIGRAFRYVGATTEYYEQNAVYMLKSNRNGYVFEKYTIGDAPVAYDKASDGARLYDVYFSSGNFVPVDDSVTPFDDGGTASGTAPNTATTQWRKSMAITADTTLAREFVIEKEDTDGKADHRQIGYFPAYDLENKTYTLEFEFCRNFEKRHKVYFACGNFTDAQTGGAVTNGGYDSSMPCLAIELNKASVKAEYNHHMIATVYDEHGEGPTEIAIDVINSNSADLSSRFAEYIPIGHDIVSYGSGYEYGGEVTGKSGNTIHTAGTFYAESYEGEIRPSYSGSLDFFVDSATDIVTLIKGGDFVDYKLYRQSAGFVNDTNLFNRKTIPFVKGAEGEFAAALRIVLKGGARKATTLYEKYGEAANVPSGASPANWTGDIIPVDFTIYHGSTKIAAGTVYQPAKHGIVFGVGNYDVLGNGEYYGVRNLTIYKGDTMS